MEMMKGETELFGGTFATRIGCERTVTHIGFNKRNLLGVAVHRRRRGEDEIVGMIPPGSIEKVQGADQVDIIIEMWLVDGRAYPGHGRQMHDRFDGIAL